MEGTPSQETVVFFKRIALATDSSQLEACFKDAKADAHVKDHVVALCQAWMMGSPSLWTQEVKDAYRQLLMRLK